MIGGQCAAPEMPMSIWTETEAKLLATDILGLIRAKVSALLLDDDDRRPEWLEAARVRAGWMGPTLVLVIEDAGPSGDCFKILGEVQADTAVLLDSPGLRPVGWTQDFLAKADRTVIGAYGDSEAAPRFVLPYGAGWQRAEPYPKHGTLALSRLSFQMDVSPDDTSPGLMRIIPAGLYVSKLGTPQLGDVAEWFASTMADQIREFVSSNAGKAVARRRTRQYVFEVAKTRSVIVLGAYQPDAHDELVRVRDYLTQARGYDAALIEDFPDLRAQSPSDKVRMWTVAARFCVMVDRVPAGHVAEYEMLSNQHTILALLRQRGHGSTSMIGEAHIVDLKFFELFEFATSPLEVLDDAVAWAEDVIKKREAAYRRPK